MPKVSPAHGGIGFEWDADKARANLAKHGVSFAQAVEAFADPRAVLKEDVLHSHQELRYVLIGRESTLQTLTVVHCERAAGSVFRIISARLATAAEELYYLTGG